MKLSAAVTSDIDTLESIYNGHGCRRPGGYTSVEFRMGLENFSRFLEPYAIKATLFMVGNDFRFEKNKSHIQAIVDEGHEIGNHTLTHAQGFRLMSAVEKQAEIAGMEKLCEQVTGIRPLGFRAPGWNMSDDAVSILMQRGYLYDSSIHPTSLTPLLKFLHWLNTSSRQGGDRTTLGQMSYMIAPIQPYHTSITHLRLRGDDGLIEFPLTVLPILRIPFWATFLLSSGFEFFKICYVVLKRWKMSIQYSFHLSDFVDYDHPDLIDQVPRSGDGVYVPQALRMPLKAKLELFCRALDLIANDYQFDTLKNWCRYLPPST
jgi:peptidoglycan/xylan/chitin deacetylase (PgdA/CDA1 family)